MSLIEPFQQENINKPGSRFPFFKLRRMAILLLTAVGILSSTACLWFQMPLLRGEDAARESSDLDDYQLSGAQSDLLSSQGYPEAFTILFYEEVGLDGSLQDVRQETWIYYTAGESYTFLNGVLDSREKLEDSRLGSLAALPYNPEQFSAGMSMEDVLVSAGLEDFIEIPLDKQFLENGRLYYGDSLAFGFVDDDLRYLEALAVTEE